MTQSVDVYPLVIQPPPALPVDADVLIAEARPLGWVAGPLPAVRVDGCAIASVVLGFTGIVPVVSQVAGLILGTAALRRIRRSRREGRDRRGTGWAAFGLVTNAVGLIGWLAVFAGYVWLASSVAGSTSALDRITHGL